MSYSIKIKLISKMIKVCFFSLLTALICTISTKAIAEYYVVCSPPPVVIEKRIYTAPAAVVKKFVRKKRHYKAYRCKRVKAHYRKVKRVYIVPKKVVKVVTPVVVKPVSTNVRVGTPSCSLAGAPTRNCQCNYVGSVCYCGRTCIPGYWNNPDYNQDMRTDDDVAANLNIDY